MDNTEQKLLIFVNGEWKDGSAVQKTLREYVGATVIAADGGARHALAQGLTIDAIFGDMDSISPELRDSLHSSKTGFHQFPTEKDETDTELCLQWALSEGYTQWRILAALGGRADQHHSNILLLSAPEWIALDVAIVSGDELIRVHPPGMHLFQGAPSARISLIPLTPIVREIHTDGLQYALRGEDLYMSRSRGISNTFYSKQAEITFMAGTLLTIQQIS